MDFSNYNLPFNAENAKELSGGSRSQAYSTGQWIIRIPTSEKFLLEQQREAEISSLLQNRLPEHIKSKITDVIFNGKCAYHKEIFGNSLEYSYTNMDEFQRNILAKDIAEILFHIHTIPVSDVLPITEKYSKSCRNENKTALADFDYSLVKEQIYICSNDKINLDNFKTEIPSNELVLCHNDLHSGNIIIKNNKLSGFIDFGEAGINPRINDFFHLYRTDRNLAIKVINEYNKLTDVKIDIKSADYQFLSKTGYKLSKRKNDILFRQEVTKVLENFIDSRIQYLKM